MILDILSLNGAWGALTTLVTGAIGGQILNHFIITKKEEKKAAKEAISRFYIPLYGAITSYFESHTAFRKGDLTDIGRTPNVQRANIINFIENNLHYAGTEVAEAFYKKKHINIYDDNWGFRDFSLENDLLCKVLKSYYLLASKKRKFELKKEVLLFQIWQLCFKIDLPSPDEALSVKYYFNLDKLASQYNIEELDEVINMNGEYEKQKIFLEKLLLQIVDDKSGQEYVISQFFGEDTLWEDSQSIYEQEMVNNIIKDIEEGPLTIRNRQSLRNLILDEMCQSYFYSQNYNYSFSKNHFSNLPKEKKLALEYLVEKGMVCKEHSPNNSITFRPTAEGIDLFESS